jgi:GxxExxY protein
MDVLNTLKPRLDEKIYERALVAELEDKHIHYSQQRHYPVYYKNRLLGELIPDLIIDSKVIIDLKVVADFNDTHISQMIGYLAITELKIGLLINFKYRKLQWKRIIRQIEKDKSAPIL